MRRGLRAGWRLVAVGGVIAGFSLVFEVGRLLLIGRPARRARWRAVIFRRWATTLLWVLGVRLELLGEPPRAPFFLVSNHLSYVDILVLASQLQAVFIAKREVASWPIFGPICRRLDTIFIDRSARRDVPRVLDAARAAFDRGDGVVLFPEGTSTAGATVLPFRPSLLDLPARLAEPVHFASLSYATDGARDGGDRQRHAAQAVCWWGDMTFPGHFWRLLGLSGIDCRLEFGSRAIACDDRKELAAKLHQAVSDGFRPVVGAVVGFKS